MLIHATNEMRVMRGGYRQYVGKADMKRPLAHLFIQEGEAMCSRKLDDDMELLDSIPVEKVCRQCLVTGFRHGWIQPDEPSTVPHMIDRLVGQLSEFGRLGILEEWTYSGLVQKLKEEKKKYAGHP